MLPAPPAAVSCGNAVVSAPISRTSSTFSPGASLSGVPFASSCCHAGETAGSPGVRTVIIDLKNHPEPPLVNSSGYPNAFPRPHVDKLFENDRVVVWHYRWFLNEPTPVHFHDKDVVVTYLEDSALQSTEPNGKVVLNEYKSGDIRFNRGNRVHSELVVRGSASAVLMELK